MKRRWRILHLTPTIAETNGQYNEHCLPLLGERDLTLCSFHRPAIEPARGLSFFHGSGTTAGYLRALCRALRQDPEFDVIHAHHARAGVFFLLAALLRPRYLARSVYTIQNSYRNYRLGQRLLLPPILASYRRVVMCSTACLDSMPGWLRRLGGSRIRVVPNAVDVDRVTRAVTRGRAARRAGTFVVVCVGRLIAIKDPLGVLRAFARAAEPDWRLRFLGDGALRPMVLAEAAARGLTDQVEAPGLVPRDAVFEAIGAADVVVSASRGEGLPVAVLEAMACGCPVILSDIPPHREVVRGARFVPLVETDDVEGLARAMRGLRSLSAAERESIGALTRNHVQERFGLPAMHAAYERIYDEISGTRPQTPLDRVPMGARQ